MKNETITAVALKFKYKYQKKLYNFKLNNKKRNIQSLLNILKSHLIKKLYNLSKKFKIT